MKTYLHDGIRILYNTQTPSRFYMHKAHFHDEYELYCLTDGSLQFYIEDKVYPLSGGSLAFVDGEMMHRSFSSDNEPYTRVVICIKKAKLQKEFPALTEPFRKGGAFSLSADEQTQLRRLLELLKTECENDMPLRHETIRLLVAELLIDVFRLYLQRESAVNDCHGTALELIGFINSHYNEKFTLEDISHTCNISISHLTRLFRASTGYSVVEYTNNLRVKKAAELIKSTTLSISDISAQCGFQSFSYFSKLFKECFRISPRDYRNSR